MEAFHRVGGADWDYCYYCYYFVGIVEDGSAAPVEIVEMTTKNLVVHVFYV